jgi:hypothetical protein
MIFCRIFSVIFLFITLNSYQASAQDSSKQNPYLIKNIFAIAQDDSAYIARKNAITQANREAFIILLKNLAIAEDVNEQISDEEIEEAVYSKQIKQERISKNKYSARFDIMFLPNAIESLLEGQRVQRVFKEGELVFLILPIESNGDKDLLWEEDNYWYKSIENYINITNNRNIILPTGDYEDISNITTQDLIDNNFSNLSNSIAKYGANSFIIAQFNFDKIENKATIFLNITKPESLRKLKLSFVNAKNLKEADLINEVAQRTIKYITDTNESKTKKIDHKLPDKIVINVKISNLREWIEIKDTMKTIPFIKNLELKSISRNEAKVIIDHDSNYLEMIEIFNDYNLKLERSNNNQYLLSAI